jgi:hypothetical protein
MLVSEIPATVAPLRHGKASENRDESEDLPEEYYLIFKAFGNKSAESFN